MRAAARARLLLVAVLLLSAALCGAAKGAHRASRKRSVRSRVSLSGSFSPAQRAQLREKHDAGWSNVTLARTCGKPPRGYDPPQWRREAPPSRRVALRGWLACNAAAGVYESLFALPPPAWPARDEAFTASFKGKQRTLSISPADGVGRLVRARRAARAARNTRKLTLRFRCSRRCQRLRLATGSRSSRSHTKRCCCRAKRRRSSRSRSPRRRKKQETLPSCDVSEVTSPPPPCAALRLA
jgi:hypothetical protein